MQRQQTETQAREAAVLTLLAKHPDAIVAAMANSGFRVPLPESFPLDGHQTLTVPSGRATMLEVIEPADRIAVAIAWERARRTGFAVANVHALGDTDTALTLSMVDLRELHGIWVAMLVREAVDPAAESVGLTGPIDVPARPRQATMHKNQTAVITEIDENVTKMLGWTEEQLIGARSSEFLHPDDSDRAVGAWMQLLSTSVSQRVRVRHRCADGSWLWIEIENIHNGLEDADDVDVIAQLSDISDEMAAHEALHRREQLFSRLAEALPTGVLQLGEDGTVVYANARLGAILRTDKPVTRADLIAIVAPADRDAVEQAVDAALKEGRDSELEVAFCPPRSTECRRCALTVAAVDDQEGQPGALVCVSDVTESAQLREQLRIQATHDALTGCLNRSAVLAALEELLTAPDQRGTVAVFVDIDNFKPVNDRLGHAAGDGLLIHVARRLKHLCREHDLVARLGGDEFLLVCRGSDSPADPTAVAARVREALAEPIALQAEVVELCSSVGVAQPDRGITAEALISRADAAMYECKRRRDGVPVHFDEIAPTAQDEAA